MNAPSIHFPHGRRHFAPATGKTSVFVKAPVLWEPRQGTRKKQQPTMINWDNDGDMYIYM